MESLIALFGNIWFRRLALVGVVLAALLFARQHYIGVGRQQGQQAEAQHSIQSTEQTHQADLQQVTVVLSQLQQKIEASERRQETLSQAVLALATQRQQAKAEVAGMTADQLAAVLERYSQRDLVNCVTQLPLCEKERETQATKITEIEGEVLHLKTKFSTLNGYTGRLENYYVQVWNAASQPRRSAKCVWLWRCSRPQLKAPAPAEALQRPAGNGG